MSQNISVSILIGYFPTLWANTCSESVIESHSAIALQRLFSYFCTSIFAHSEISARIDRNLLKFIISFFFFMKSEHQMTALFMKIDSSSDGEINWDEFCTYMQLEYAEKEESNFRAKEVSSQEQISSKSASRLRLNVFFC